MYTWEHWSPAYGIEGSKAYRQEIFAGTWRLLAEY
jgi:hypothetical protein